MVTLLRIAVLLCRQLDAVHCDMLAERVRHPARSLTHFVREYSVAELQKKYLCVTVRPRGR
jgi:hypothetical protein